MKYTFTTKFNEKVTLDRSIFTGKVKVFVDGKPVASSHHGQRGATGTFYPLKGSTLEVRSNLLELVPSAWYNEDWVDLVPPLKTWQYLIIGLPFLSASLVTFGQIPGMIVGLLGSLECWLIMLSQRPLNTRLTLSVIIAVLTPLLALGVSVGVAMMSNGGQ